MVVPTGAVRVPSAGFIKHHHIRIELLDPIGRRCGRRAEHGIYPRRPQLIYDPVKPLKMKFTLARLCFRPGKLSHAGNFYACLLHHRNIPVLLCLVTVLGIIRRAEQYRIIYIKFFFIHSSHLT